MSAVRRTADDNGVSPPIIANVHQKYAGTNDSAKRATRTILQGLDTMVVIASASVTVARSFMDRLVRLRDVPRPPDCEGVFELPQK
jgi:hypothetical protein